MNDFENQLREHMARKQPPAGFFERVVLRTRRANSTWRKWTASALAACLALAGGLEVHRYQQGQYAKQQVLLALRITMEKTHAAQEKIEQINQRSILP